MSPNAAVATPAVWTSRRARVRCIGRHNRLARSAGRRERFRRVDSRCIAVQITVGALAAMAGRGLIFSGAVVVLRCTQTLLKRLHQTPVDAPASSTVLGDWYANILWVYRKPLVLAVSARTLLPVLLPRAGYKFHSREHGVRLARCSTFFGWCPGWLRIWVAVASNWLRRTRFFDNSSSSPSGRLPAASGGRSGSASRLYSPRESHQLGVKRLFSSGPRPFFAGI